MRSKSNGYFVRVWNLVKEASRFFDRVVVLEFPEEQTLHKQAVKGTTFVQLRGNEADSGRFASVLKKIFTFDPFQNLKFQLLSFIELWRYREYVSTGDVVLIEGSLIPAGIVVAKLLGKKTILDTHGMNKLLAKRFKGRKSLAYLSRILLWDVLERLTTRLSDLVIVVSGREKDFVIEGYGIGRPRVFVVPNALESGKSVPNGAAVQALKADLRIEGKIVISFVGDLRIVHNFEAVEFITGKLAPAFWKTRKDVIFLIIGKGNERYGCDLPNVFFTGFVEDLDLYMELSDICVAPLAVGCGTKTKVIEYLVHGKPIVATPVGMEGLEALIHDYSGDLISIVPLDSFHEALQRSISNLGRSDEIKVEVNQVLIKDLRSNLKEVFCCANQV